MKSRICASKKGIGIDDAIPIVIFILVAALVIFLFNITQNTKSAKAVDNIQIQKDRLYGNEALLEYLQKTDENGDNKIDFLSKNYNDKNYEVIRKDILDYFNIKLSHLPIWYIEFYDMSNREIFQKIGIDNIHPSQLHLNIYQTSSINIPTGNGNYIIIKLYFSEKPK